MLNGIMIGQIPVIIRELNEVISGQGDRNLAASNNIHVMFGENYNINERNENGTDVNSTGQHSPPESSSQKRRRQCRHTKSQISSMEAYFKNCPHPDDGQRKQLALELGLNPFQVKFWFQNKRTHTKTQDEHKVNNELRTENEKFVAENISCKHVISNLPCHLCGTPAVVLQIATCLDQLYVQNKWLKEQIERMNRITDNYGDNQVIESSLPQTVPVEVRNMSFEKYIAYLNRFSESNMPLINEAANTSMNELINMIQVVEPLWIPNGEGKGYVLNEEEYFKAFPTVFRNNLINWRIEGSMFSAMVMVSPSQAVDLFMDVNKWLSIYPNFVSKVRSIYRPPTGSEGTEDGDIQMMSAELQIPCPVVSTREYIFTRKCKQLSPQIWAIVDFSLYNILPQTALYPSSKCLRLPSGCVIQEMTDGFSKVTWVEHVAVNVEFVHHLVAPIPQSEYGATSWLSIFQRQCERIAYTTLQSNLNNLSGSIVAGQGEGRNIILKLCERMCGRYYGGASASDAQEWAYISGNGVEDPKIMKRDNVNDTHMPFGVIVSASLCIQLPIPPGFVFDFICNETTRTEWDALCDDGNTVQKTIHFPIGQEGNCVTVLRVIGNKEQQDFLIIQETNTDITSSSIIFAPLDMGSMMTLLSNEANVDEIGILPSGFTILPSQLPLTAFVGRGPSSFVGTLLTASFQISTSSYPGENLSAHSIEIVKNVVNSSIQNITDALMARFG